MFYRNRYVGASLYWLNGFRQVWQTMREKDRTSHCLQDFPWETPRTNSVFKAHGRGWKNVYGCWANAQERVAMTAASRLESIDVKRVSRQVRRESRRILPIQFDPSVTPTFPYFLPTIIVKRDTANKMADSDSSSLSSAPSSEDEAMLAKMNKPAKTGLHRFFNPAPKPDPTKTPKTKESSSPPPPKRAESPPHEYVLADNADIAVRAIREANPLTHSDTV